jgi:hypothetical protein
MGRSGPAGTANEADMVKMALPSWSAVTRRAENDRPSRSRSTRNEIGRPLSPGRKK